ncbi:MAG: SCO family protein [Verrucomicrobiota bacterium]|nr:SCO family protein [Verrucomicrobiota bacterium]
MLFCLCACSKIETRKSGKGLLEDEVRGEVVRTDQNRSVASIKITSAGSSIQDFSDLQLNDVIEVELQPGDFNLLSRKNIFKGRLQSSFSPKNGEIFLLHSVWPDEFRERIRFNNVNRLLRRDTLTMGTDSIRSVGDQVPPFAMYDQDGEIITTDYLDGSVTILNFIFTRCSEPDMCPAATLKMKKLQELVEKTKIPYVKFLSITLDPLFDTPGVLKSYARGYNLEESNFRLGTAGKSVIDDLTRQFGIMRKKEPDTPLDHTMRTIVINSRRQIVYQVPGKGWSVEDFLGRLQGQQSI